MPFTKDSSRDARRIKATNFAARIAARREKNRVRIFAVQAIQLSMKNGLEWAVKNPRTFVRDGGAVVDGADLTAEQEAAVTEVLQELLDRLLRNPKPLWLGLGGKKPGTKNRATVEREAAEAGARRGW